MNNITENEKEVLSKIYKFDDPISILTGPHTEEQTQLINTLTRLRENFNYPNIKRCTISNNEIDKKQALTLAKAENNSVMSLDPDERKFYELYLLKHINKTNAKGEPVKPIHVNIADLVLCNDRVITLNQDLYIYDFATGTYCLDSDGKNIKCKIRSYLDRDFREDKIINAIYNLIISDSKIAISSDQINNRPKHWIHFINGYYDYKTDKFLPHNPDYYEISVIPWEYLPSQYPGNYKFTKQGKGLLRETIEEDLFFNTWIEETIPDPLDREMLYQYIVYAMSLDTSAQKFLLISGPGGTGKSTILKLIEDILGKSNVSSVSLQGLQDRFAPSNLFLKQGNICADIPLTALSEVDMIKKLTGEDTISADRKFKSAFTFKSYARLFFSANDIPYINEKTNAFYRRMLILKMNHKPIEIDPNLYHKIKSEIPNIIVKIVQRYNGEIITSPNSIQAVKGARKQSDTVEAFIDDRCIADKNARVSRVQLYRDYCNYCDNEERKRVTRSHFYKQLSDKGFQSRRSKTNYDICGLKINNVISLHDVNSSC